MDLMRSFRSAASGRTGWQAVGLLAAALWAAQGWAQTEASEAELMRTSQRWLDQAVTSARDAATVPLRMEVKVGQLDSRLKLAACGRVEPYLPPGVRLWGNTRLGLRCVDGRARWNVFLPVTVKAYGQAWVMRRDVASGATLTEADLMAAEVDWAEEPSPVLATPQQWLGQVALRTLMTGQTLRQSMVRPAQVFQAGATVRVVAQGAGFQIASDGQALAAGVVGQLVKIRMDNGRIMAGTVLDARTVKVDI
jgi:flagella basal body P-ring formation protein FlgA